MSGEPQPADRGDKLDRAVFGLRTIWFGLFAGGLILVMTLVVLVFSREGIPLADLGDLGYLFLLPLPLGLLAAFFIPPRVAKWDPTAIVVSARTKNTNVTFSEWPGTTPDEPFYWFPVYVSVFFIRAGILEGAALICALGGYIIPAWLMFGAAAFLLAVLLLQMPTRAAAESFAEAARRRNANTG